MMKGYGRGWGEPLAKGRWARMRQRMREPATTRDWWIASITAYGCLVAIIVTLTLF